MVVIYSGTLTVVELWNSFFVKHERSLYVLLHDLRAHMLLHLAGEEFSKRFKAEDSDSSCRETWLADPYVLLAVNRAVLWIQTLQFLVHLVGLIHHINIRDFPPAELKQIRVHMAQLDLTIESLPR